MTTERYKQLEAGAMDDIDAAVWILKIKYKG